MLFWYLTKYSNGYYNTGTTSTHSSANDWWYIHYSTLMRTCQQKSMGGGLYLAKSMITPFGKEVKKRLVDLEQSQDWLIQNITTKTGLFMDSGYMHKILTGERSAPKVVQAIREILDIPEVPEG